MQNDSIGGKFDEYEQDINHHESDVFHEELKTDIFSSDNETSDLGMYNVHTENDESDPSFQTSDQIDTGKFIIKYARCNI